MYLCIPGLEELVALQELDLADNFLLDHRVLEPLQPLTRLIVVRPGTIVIKHFREKL